MAVTTPSFRAAKWDCQMAPFSRLNKPHWHGNHPHLPNGSSRYVGAVSILVFFYHFKNGMDKHIIGTGFQNVSLYCAIVEAFPSSSMTTKAFYLVFYATKAYFQ